MSLVFDDGGDGVSDGLASSHVIPAMPLHDHTLQHFWCLS